MENVRMYCNRGCLFSVSGFYFAFRLLIIPNLVQYLFRTQSSIYSEFSLIFIPHSVQYLFSTQFSIQLHSSDKFKSLLNNMKSNPALSLFCLIFEINRKTVTQTVPQRLVSKSAFVLSLIKNSSVQFSVTMFKYQSILQSTFLLFFPLHFPLGVTQEQLLNRTE